MIIRLAARRTEPELAVPWPPEPLEIEACYHYCESLARSRHHNFPVASFFVPTALRKHIWAVYAFARTADDFADEPSFEGRRARELDRWDEKLHASYHGENPDHPVFVALGDTIKRFNLPITEFSALLSGFRMDLETSRYATQNDLRNYTRLSSEPVGHLFLYLGGYRDADLHAYADDLSSALAMAKLWQDIAADADRGRIYLPREDLRHFGVSEAQILEKRGDANFGVLMRYNVARTRALFERARPLVDKIGPNLAIEMAIAWHGGMRILDKILATGPGLLTERPHLTNVDKAAVVSQALAWRGRALGWRVFR